LPTFNRFKKTAVPKLFALPKLQDGWASKALTNVHGMNIGGGFNFDFGRVKMVNAVHSSALPDGS
jgi:L-ascorbate metabolism protein UlaG (beta-lactamase superfamily)